MKILRPTQLANQLGVSKSTLWRLEKSGELPKRITISERIVGWKESDIEEWLEEKQNSGE
ncbi:transcriptional regulator [Balneola sp. EhC07]|uniref:helix-turn-helix transcriptional regulator n=1 Tax=Balneola sp. EhC07 TaxID=1849360 RepID=UPI0007F3BE91|nr:AlpA family phage regulatory protein [Balneola sp. EhC07]OAN61023.1 transcriptional regulator [Balneola sp. EhC07]